MAKNIETFSNEDLYIVYVECLNGSKYLYSKNHNVDYIFTYRQLKSVLAHLKRKNLKHEVYKAQLQILDKVEV